jgi:excisionase family DNA binding protein
MNQPTLPDEFWTSLQAARYLGIKSSRIIHLARIDKIPGAWKVGDNKGAEWRFEPEKIRQYKQMREKRKADLEGTMTVAEVAKYLLVNPETIRRLTREGKISAHKDDDGPKAEWRYREEDLLTYLKPPKKFGKDK